MQQKNFKPTSDCPPIFDFSNHTDLNQTQNGATVPWTSKAFESAESLWRQSAQSPLAIDRHIYMIIIYMYMITFRREAQYSREGTNFRAFKRFGAAGTRGNYTQRSILRTVLTSDQRCPDAQFLFFSFFLESCPLAIEGPVTNPTGWQRICCFFC